MACDYLRYYLPWNRSVKIKGINNDEAFENMTNWLDSTSIWKMERLGLMCTTYEENTIDLIAEFKGIGLDLKRFGNIEYGNNKQGGMFLHEYKSKNVQEAINGVKEYASTFSMLRTWHIALEVRSIFVYRGMVVAGQDLDDAIGISSTLDITFSKFQLVNMDLRIPVESKRDAIVMADYISNSAPFSIGKKRFCVMKEVNKRNIKENLF